MSELRLLFFNDSLVKSLFLIVLGLSPDFCRAELNEPFPFLMTQSHEITGIKMVYTILSLYRLLMLSGRVR